MPTNKPRITITVEPAIYETIQRLAFLQGRSKSGVVGDLLEGVHVPLQRTVALIEAAKDAPQQVRQGLADTVESMEKEMQQGAGSSMDDINMLIDRLSGGR